MKRGNEINWDYDILKSFSFSNFTSILSSNKLLPSQLHKFKNYKLEICQIYSEINWRLFPKKIKRINLVSFEIPVGIYSVILPYAHKLSREVIPPIISGNLNKFLFWHTLKSLRLDKLLKLSGKTSILFSCRTSSYSFVNFPILSGSYLIALFLSQRYSSFERFPIYLLTVERKWL